MDGQPTSHQTQRPCGSVGPCVVSHYPDSSRGAPPHRQSTQRTSLEGNFAETFHLIQFTSHNRFQHGVIKHSLPRQEWKNLRGPFAQTLSKVVSILGGVGSRFQFPLLPSTPHPPPTLLQCQRGMETVLMLPPITEAEHLMIAYQRARFTHQPAAQEDEKEVWRRLPASPASEPGSASHQSAIATQQPCVFSLSCLPQLKTNTTD